jgi:putative ABC transport system permease protein
MLVFLKDARQGVRRWLQQPLLAVMVILTLALGIGLNSAVFTIVDALLLRPYPIPDLDKLAMLWQSWPEYGDREPVSPADFLDWKEQSNVFEPLLAIRGWGASLNADGEPERVLGFRVSPGFFEALGVTPHRGRAFMPEEGEPGRDGSVVLSHRLWTRRFAADPDIVGQTVLLDSESYTIVGIAPEGFDYPTGSDLWAPLSFDPETAAMRTWYFFNVIGRLKPGRTIEAARAQMDLIARRIALEHPETNEGTGIFVLPLNEALIDVGSKAFLALWQATVALVLLIACVNVANLLLARGADRQKELAIRMALGAGRFRIIRQLMTENLILALFGAFLSLPLAWVGTDLFRSGIPPKVVRFVQGLSEIQVDARAIAFTAGVAVLTSIVFGLLPAWQASRANLTQAIKEGGKSSVDGSSRQRGRSTLVVAEVAIALMLLVACGLCMQGVVRMIDGDRGYDPDKLLTLDISLPEAVYREGAQRKMFYQDLLVGARGLPDVAAADAITSLPSKGQNLLWPFVIEGHPVRKVDRPWVGYRVISPGFFKTMRIPLLAGRHFTEQDHESTLEVTIISETMARQFWPDENPVGTRISSGDEEDPWMTVVGVVGDVIHDGFMGGPQPTFYRPLAQAPALTMSLAVRTQGEPSSIASAVRAQVKKVDPNQSVYDVRTMRQVLSDRLGGLKLIAKGMGLFGAIALVLSAVGIYGLMAYSVIRQTHAIGIRMALGATSKDVLRLTVGAGIRLTAIGVGIGMVLAFGAGQLMASMLFGVVSLDGTTFASFSIVLMAVALLASYLPARRTLKIDPATALRQ